MSATPKNLSVFKEIHLGISGFLDAMCPEVGDSGRARGPRLPEVLPAMRDEERIKVFDASKTPRRRSLRLAPGKCRDEAQRVRSQGAAGCKMAGGAPLPSPIDRRIEPAAFLRRCGSDRAPRSLPYGRLR